MPKTIIKSGGVWRIASKIYRKDAGIQRDIRRIYKKHLGTWQLVFNNTPTVLYLTTSGTFTVPAGVYELEVTIVGGGGGGAGSQENDGEPAYGSGGGGSGGYQKVTMSVTPGQSIAYTIGSKGNGTNALARAPSGGNTTFGPYTSTGGQGGVTVAGTGGYHEYVNSGGVAGSPNTLSTAGGSAFGQYNCIATSGNGGSNPLGTGGSGKTWSSAGGNAYRNGDPGTGYGSGGGGASACQSGGSWPNGTGGSGAPGVVVVSYR